MANSYSHTIDVTQLHPRLESLKYSDHVYILIATIMNPDIFFTDGASGSYDRDRALFDDLATELADILVANVAVADLTEVQSRLLLVVIEMQRRAAPAHIGAMLTRILARILEEQRRQRNFVPEKTSKKDS